MFIYQDVQSTHVHIVYPALDFEV